jgi:hypothetical protein
MPLVFAFATLNVASNWIFGTGAAPFLLSGYTQRYPNASGGSSNVITLKEIIAGQNISGSGYVDNLTQSLGQNLQRNAVMGIGGLIAVKIAQKLVVSLGVNRSINKLSTSVGLGSTVRAN